MNQSESYTVRRCIDRGYSGKEAVFDTPYHFHPEIELLLMETSTGRRYVADSVEPYAPGDLVLIGANVPHVFVRDEKSGPASGIVLQFRADFMGGIFFEKPDLRDVRLLLERAKQGLLYGAPTVKWVAPLLKNMLKLQGSRRFALLMDLLSRLAFAPSRPLAANATRQKIRKADFARIDRVRAYIEAHCHKDIQMADAAKIVSLSPTSFSRWFSRATGNTFVEYLTDTRMARAYYSLTETRKPITEIAFDCGFNSVSHFIHRFRAIRGMSPGELRKRLEAGMTDAIENGPIRKS